MPKKLFCVTIEKIAYVLADDEYDAKFVASMNDMDITGKDYAYEVRADCAIASEWMDARPFTEDSQLGYEESDPTVGDLYRALPKAPGSEA
jgi:hypothetical protein